MKEDYSELAVRFGELLGLAQGMTLKVAHLTRQGMEFVLESPTTRTEIQITPRVYTEGKVIVDAINDLTMVVQVKQYELRDGKADESASPVGGGKVELPYSTWFFEGDYM
jgi:hypothetical protein